MGAVDHDVHRLFFWNVKPCMVGFAMKTQEKLELILLARKLSIKKMAELSELPYMTVWHYIKKGNEPSYKNFAKILKATGFSIKIIDNGMNDED